jgi:hypothetical protein
MGEAAIRDQRSRRRVSHHAVGSCVIWKHAPADAAAPQQTYYDVLVAHQAAIQTFVQSATGQTENVPFVMTQDSGNATFHQSQPQLAQLNAALNLPRRFVMWGPDYDLNHYNGSLHLILRLATPSRASATPSLCCNI